MAQRGGGMKEIIYHTSVGIRLSFKIFRHFGFSSGKIRAYELSPGSFLDFSNFDRKIFRIFNFRANIFPVF